MNNKILVIFSGIVLVLLGMFSWKVAQVTAAANLTISTATINSAGKSMAVCKG